jgi:hypothetical protein
VRYAHKISKPVIFAALDTYKSLSMEYNNAYLSKLVNQDIDKFNSQTVLHFAKNARLMDVKIASI